MAEAQLQLADYSRANTADFGRIARNVQKMIRAQALEADIDGYLGTEGLTPATFKTLVSSVTSPAQRQQAAEIMRQQAEREAGMSAHDRVLAQHGVSPEIARASALAAERRLGASDEPLAKAYNTLGEFVEGDLFGGADEALAGIHALGAMLPGGRSPGEAFSNKLEELEARRNAFREKNAGKAIAANIAGAVANPVNLLTGNWIAQGATLPARMVRAGAVGSGIGAPTGFLATEGDVVDRSLGAGIGAGVGGALGPLAQPVVEGASSLAGRVTDLGRSVLQGIRNQQQARLDPVAQAQRLLAQAIINDRFSPADMATRAASPLPGQGFVNLGGENLTALGRQATVAPGQGRTTAREFFDTQGAGQADRAADALQGLTQRGYYGTLETLDAARRQAAAPLYERAYAQPAVDQWSRRLVELMNRPSMRQAFQRAERIAAEEGRDPMELGLTFNQAGDPVFVEGALQGRIPTVQTLDYVKRGLDDVMQSQPRDPATGRIIMDESTRAIDNTRRELVGILREGNPNYAAALDAWGGPSHSIEMMDLGREIFRKVGNPADAIRRFRALSEVDQGYARIGFMREIINKVGNVSDGGSVHAAIFNTPNKRAIVETMFPDRRSFEAFARQMDAERQMVGAQRTIMGGSPTSRIDAEKVDVAPMQGAMSIWEAIRTGNPLRVLTAGAQSVGNLQRGMTPEVATELSGRLFTSDPAAMQAALLNLPPHIRATAQRAIGYRPGLAAPFIGQAAGRAGGALFSE